MLSLIVLRKKYVFVLFSLAVLALIPSVRIQGQRADFYGTARLENRLKTRFKLTNNEIGRLRPLINRENELVARTFGHYSDDRYRESFMSLWDGIRANRCEFEDRLPADLNRRQLIALRAARTEFESMVLEIWTDDYVDLLTVVLELDRFQLSGIQTIFQNETEARMRLMVRETENDSRMNTEWEKLTIDRETSLRDLLSPDQYRTYLSLGTEIENSVA